MKISVQIEPASGHPPAVHYRWDADTDILSAQLSPCHADDGMSGSVGLEGSDGSWLILDVAAGAISGVEVAVWPPVRALAALPAPQHVEDGRVRVPSRRSQPGVASLEMETQLMAESDQGRRTFHFRLGKPRDVRTIRVGCDLLLDVDEKRHITGLWLLNVPPCPNES